LKGHRTRAGEYATLGRIVKDHTVHFAPDKRGLDVDMGEDELMIEERSKHGKEKATDPQLRKRRLSDKLEPNPQKVIQQILDTRVEMSLKQALSNMPDVKKRFFQAAYPADEFEKLSVMRMQHMAIEDEEEDDSDDGRPSMGAGVGSLTLGSLPDFVYIEAEGGRVVKCASVDIDHWTDPMINRIEQSMPGEEEEEGELKADKDFKEPTRIRREYDRQAGIEHLRRECPKVPIDISGHHFLSLLDSGAELNTMRRETAERAMLPITSLPKGMRSAKMVSANGSTEGFAGIVWGVPVEIGRIRVRTNFFVLETCTNPIILGNPFLTDSRARIEYASNGLTYCRIYSEDGEYSTRFACTRGNRINAPGLYNGPVVGNVRGAQ
jgi:hypothetical protein